VVTTRRPVAVLLALAIVTCQSVPSGGPAPSTSGPVAAAPVDTGEALVFPPAPDRRERRALPRSLRTSGTDAAIAIVSPELDDEGKFEFAGQTLRLSFNTDVVADTGAVSPSLRIEPPVAGKLQMPSPSTLELVADAPFDPEATYTVTLAGVRDKKTGTAVLEGWTARFRADPQVFVGGKMLSYLPVTGDPRVVLIDAYGGMDVSRSPSFEVLFDQPTDPKKAAELVVLEKETTYGWTAVKVRTRNGKRDVYDGAKVDRRNVVAFTPTERFAPGTELRIVRKDTGVSEHEATIELEVADELRHDGVECWGTDCSYAKSKLSLGGGSFAVTYNNPLQVKGDAAQLVTITPAVPNLSVYNDGWSSTGRLNVSGAFAPSSTYDVTIAAVKDRFGQSAPPVSFTIETPALPASVSMPEGAQLVTADKGAKVVATSRNVGKAHLELWKVGEDAASWDLANTQRSNRDRPSRDPDQTIAITPLSLLDQTATTEVDLSGVLDTKSTWLVALVLDAPKFGAKATAYPEWSSAGKPPMSMLSLVDDTAIAVHTQAMPDAVIAHVAQVTTGQPVSGATFWLDGKQVEGAVSDADGVAVLPVAREVSDKALLVVKHGDAQSHLRLGQGGKYEAELAPHLQGTAPLAADTRAMVLTDRGVYRPGSKIFFKAIARRRDGAELPALVDRDVRLRIVSPTGDEVHTELGKTNAHGSLWGELETARNAEIGRYSLVLEPVDGSGPGSAPVWAETTIQVAEFEPPRFAVDVTASAKGTRMTANVAARYLFGAPMGGAHVDWTIVRKPTSLPRGELVARGLAFAFDDDGYEGEWEGEWEGEDGEGGGTPQGEPWTQIGEAKLDEAGKLTLERGLEMPKTTGPQRFVFEATVQDESHRTIAARADATLFDAPHYAGVRVTDGSVELPRDGSGATVPLELGVADHEGNPKAGVEITAVLERLDWERVRKPAASSSYYDDWHEVRREVARCKVESARAVVTCPLTIERSADYVVTAWIDGKAGGSDRFWAWSYGDATRSKQPTSTLELVADRTSYAPGDTAKVEVTNPFTEAIAIVTLEGGAARVVQSRRLTNPSEIFELPLSAEHAPWAHATATVLPIDKTPEAVLQWRFGALRLPVDSADARVDLAVTSDKPVYQPGEKATLQIAVSRGSAPVEGAEVALAVVDEGVLRLTSFHAPDPTAVLRAGTGLSLHVLDNRDLFAPLGVRAHVSGDGGTEGDSSLVTTRKNFVQTALWRPDLVTDAEGRATVELPLPDNLTEFRMMAVALDGRGRGAVQESSFEVRKPLMVVPAVPRFAVVGDAFEAAAVVHNGSDAQTTATVTMGDATKEITLPAGGRERVGFPFAASTVGPQTLAFSASASNGAVDRVEVPLPVHAPGIVERPRLAGSFTRGQSVDLEIPDDIFTSPDHEHLLVTMGAALWPELGERVEYLVDYPHGCVEQTTSSTLPLLAAREMLPRMGFVRYTSAQIDERILAGVERLASMKTSDGGLAYWPGHGDSNPFGTAYAMRAIVRAEAAGIAIPAGLREGMTSYLQSQLTSSSSVYPGDLEVRAAIALALAEAGALPASAADGLFEHAAKQGPFGQATLALALSTLPGESKRVEQLLDLVVAAFDATGKQTSASVSGELAYYGSKDRTRAQAALALVRLRPSAQVLPAMLDAIAAATDDYTTQSTAFGLLTLSEHLATVAREPVSLALFQDGEQLVADAGDSLRMGVGALRYRIPLASLRGRKVRLQLAADGEVAIGFLVEATWQRPFAATGSLAATSAKRGPDLYRVITSPVGEEVDLSKVDPGQMLRVTLLARMPGEDFDSDRRGFVAITDAIGAGFEPVQPELATMTTPPDVPPGARLGELLGWGTAEPSHSELHDDRVDLYFDRVWGDWVVGSYLVRATTPGTFVVAPARVELMYEPNSTGYSDVANVTVVE
jgi:hypothetical protein